MLNPRENLKLRGHNEAREAFIKAISSDKFHHAWIITGPKGIGKATFAFHMARYLLTGLEELSSEDPTYRQIVADSHGDVRVVGGQETGEIGVEAIRDVNTFLSQTSMTGGYRIVLIDGADQMNRNASNALLKRLEEPPPKTVFFLITSLPGRLLPTIRSRCQVLALSPLSASDVQHVLKDQGYDCPADLSLEEGSPGRLMGRLEEPGVQIYSEFKKVLDTGAFAPFIQTYVKEEASYTLIEDMVRSYLHMNILEKAMQQASLRAERSNLEIATPLTGARNDGGGLFQSISLDRALDLCEKIEGLFDACQFAGLDKKATLTCVFETLHQRT
jgi:DNA polymerase-3 subunit delta'